jgi:hypothetical protein
MDALMSMIDDVKTKLTDEEYKQLCDKMMALNKKHWGYYRVWYVITDTQFVEDSDDDDDDDETRVREKKPTETKYYDKINNVVVQLPSEKVAEMRRIILKVGRCYAHSHTLKLSSKGNLPVLRQSKGIACYFRPSDPECYSVIRIDDLE